MLLRVMCGPRFGAEAAFFRSPSKAKPARASRTTIGTWRTGASDGKEKRLAFLYEKLGLPHGVSDAIRYQLMHRAASALIEAERIGATAAVMLVLSFADDTASKRDYDAFVSSLGAKVAMDRLVCTSSTVNCPLFPGWLEMPPSTDADIVSVAV